MSKAKENTFEIIEREILLLKNKKELSLPDMRRLEMLTNIRKVLIHTGSDVEQVVLKHDDISDSEVLEVLSKPWIQNPPKVKDAVEEKEEIK